MYINPNRIERIEGLHREESDALLDALYEHAFQPRFEYRHGWHLRGVVIWDNRCTIHRATPDYPPNARRVLHRVMLRGTVPVWRLRAVRSPQRESIETLADPRERAR